MRQWLIIAVAVLCMTAPGLAASGPQLSKNELFEQQYAKESNPRKRADLAKKIAKQRLEELRTRIANGIMLEQASPELQKYQEIIEGLGDSVREAAHNGTTKSAEKFLRDQIHTLDDLKMNLSSSERPFLEKIIERTDALREEMLDALMRPRQPKNEEQESASK